MKQVVFLTEYGNCVDCQTELLVVFVAIIIIIFIIFFFFFFFFFIIMLAVFQGFLRQAEVL
jgi:hypothetical protein